MTAILSCSEYPGGFVADEGPGEDVAEGAAKKDRERRGEPGEGGGREK